jgi:hypothetical protein
VVVDEKAIANRLANRLSEIAFGEMGVVVEARILPETLKEFHLNKNPRARGHTVGLVRDGSVTLFNSVDLGQYLQYVREEIAPMTQPPRISSGP